MKKKEVEKAVAILYDQQKGSSPKVVASGKGEVARRIIETAREAGVHIQEDPNLVELLSKIKLGDEIPTELYQTVAEVLAFVYQVNEKFKDKIGTTT
ncbi:MAG: EscU/YscU/HrcU family type III secretion system export apparatus switch protein [Proteobacteria bacterium]|nr:EscU/YscU/HrcU family type III secretion system export apparatus switch protein [Pseudomonadota bacterium]MBU1419551.1 EscU/YscU/HrcU family type III secretion system export apparatus switch protein [Pseudomonadota bacterium]MBU1456585.1 EscU/YscU/HrcU family type III secretion system export apparatus switch protein [Pseudomonadota bacterium]